MNLSFQSEISERPDKDAQVTGGTAAAAGVRGLRWVCSLFITAFITAFIASCGGAGGDNDGATSSGSATVGSLTVSGSIAGQSGGQSRMAGWVVVLIERDTNISRVGVVNAAGVYSISGVRGDAVHSLTLLSPDYLVRGVFAVPSETQGKLLPFFSITSDKLPRMIHRGYTVTPQSMDGISVATDSLTDADSDGAPDGTSNLGLVTTSSVDLDSDGLVNELDADIDGDGLLNVFDNDDDGDGTPDVMDSDANGNQIPDLIETSSDQHFRTGIEFLAVSFEMFEQDDGSFKSYLNLASKVRDGVNPLSVQIRGPLSLLNGAKVEGTELVPESAWDKRLLDDGLSEDGFESDALFSRKVLLAADKTPRPFQMLFLQLGFNSVEDPQFAEFPFTFPDIDLGSISFAWTAATRTVVIDDESEPFGDETNYSWSVSITDSDGLVIYESALIAAETNSVIIPDKLLDSGSEYTMRVNAQLQDRIPGYPSFIVHSTETEFTY